MSDSLVLQGQLYKGPLGATDCGGGGTCQIPFSLNPMQKVVGASIEATKVIANAVFTALPGIGAGGLVTQATTLFIQVKGSAVMQFRITFHPDTGPDFTSVVYTKGLLIIEPPDGNYIALVEALGSGTVQYLATGTV